MLNEKVIKQSCYKVTVITVSYNAEKTIKDTIESVLLQEGEAFEYIIKDGGSKDHTNEIVKSYMQKLNNSRIEFTHIVSEDSGIYGAMNEAAYLAQGEFLLFLNADDQLYNTKVILNFAVFVRENIRCDVLYGDTLMKDKTGLSIFRANMSIVCKRMPFAHQSCFVRTEKFRKFGFNERYKICADYDFILTLYQNRAVFCDMKQIISIYSLGGISSTQFIPKVKEHLEILEQHGQIKQYSFIKLIKILEAWIKTLIMEYFPDSLEKCLKGLYKTYIKKYEEIN